MKFNDFPILNGRLAAILLLLALGQVGEIVHQSEHGIADFAERCATCVHLDQPAQSAAPATALPLPVFTSERAPQFAAAAPCLRRPSHFEPRAPPA